MQDTNMPRCPTCFRRASVAAVLVALSLAGPAGAATLDIRKATVADVQAAFAAGLTSEQLTSAYLKRIEAYDKKGPTINTVIHLNPKALEEARKLDAERRSGKSRGAMHGIPVVLKDNYDTYDMPTTAGSQLLAGHVPPDDAYAVKKLRESGAIILAKLNLSEFAGGGGSTGSSSDPAIVEAGRIPNGYSSMGGQTLNPHDLTRGPSGSSGGTGAAISAVFAQLGLGTDTGGSVRGPCAANGIVGLKPTLGLISRDGIVPLALSFDTGGPMARSVYDVALSLGVMAGVDPADPATAGSAARSEKDYTRFLRSGALKGARIGIARDFMGKDAGTDAVVESAIASLKRLGAVIVDPVRYPDYLLQSRQGISVAISPVEFKAQIADYLKTTRAGYPKNLAELATEANDPATGYRSPGKAFGLKYQAARAGELTDAVYIAAKTEGLALVRATVLAVFANHKLDAIVYPTSTRPAQPIDAPNPRGPTESATNIANQTGFPDLVVPAGMTPEGLPVTLSFLGPAWSEPKLLAYGYDFEQATQALVLPKHTPALPSDVITW